uniref:Uncharacterized protein n=1 Tax=Russula subnigricans TaxID=258989 RepID=A0A649WIA9_9AGAM|nr:hypothetical protein [Russula subnigricans]QGK88093.1 hypothetical protein [Russula subnigricans]
MFIILFLFLIFTQIYYGISTLIPIFIFTLILLFSNFILSINPESNEGHIIRFLSIITIIFLLWYNYDSNNLLCSILPLSIDRITYFEDIMNTHYSDLDNVYVDNKQNKKYLYFLDISEISDFLNTLNINDNYVVCIELIVSKEIYFSNEPRLLLSKPFLINRFSSATTISKFIDERVSYTAYYYNLDDSLVLIKD